MTPPAESAGAPPGAAGSRPVLLVLDDQQEVTLLVARWLSDIGDVHTATTSAQAFALASVVKPDLAIVDVVVPRVDGIELVAALRRNPGLSRMAVIFITGSDRIDIPARAIDVGAAEVLYKPLEEDVLRIAVLAALAREAHGT